MIGKEVTVIVDRPMGSHHPKHSDMVYPVNYGYVPGIKAPDGEYQDVYILGVDKPVAEFTGVVIAIVHRHNDIEDKWVVAAPGYCFAIEEIAAKIQFQEQYFHSKIILTDIE